MNYRNRKQHISRFVKALDLSPLLSLFIEEYGYAALKFLNVLILWGEEVDQDSNLVKDKSLNKFRATAAYDTFEIYLRRYNLIQYTDVFRENGFLNYFKRINRKVVFFVDNTDQISIKDKRLILGILKDWYISMRDYFAGFSSNNNSILENDINYINDLLEKYSDEKSKLEFAGDNKPSELSVSDILTDKKKGYNLKFEDLFIDQKIINPLIEYLKTEKADYCLSTAGDWSKTNTELVAFTKALMNQSFIHNRFFEKDIYKLVTEKFNVKMVFQFWNRKWKSKDKILDIEPFNNLLQDFKLSQTSV